MTGDAPPTARIRGRHRAPIPEAALTVAAERATRGRRYGTSPAPPGCRRRPPCQAPSEAAIYRKVFDSGHAAHLPAGPAAR
jgi:hypothetical protein